MYTFENRDIARRAGKISKRGKSQKSLQWEKLGENIVTGFADKVVKELNKLEGMQFITAYTSLLKYFKPTLRSVDMLMEPPSEINVSYAPTDLYNKSNAELIELLKQLDNVNEGTNNQ